MPSAASKTTRSTSLTAEQPGLWRFGEGAFGEVAAGVLDRTTAAGGAAAAIPEILRARADWADQFIQAEQVHGASVAAVETGQPLAHPLPGCDALVTSRHGRMLLIRTADCMPLFAWDAARRIVGLAHVGWRGLSKQLPMHLAMALRQWYQSRMDDLWWAIGPSIRSCCYDVGAEFEPRFGRFVRTGRDGRRVFDLAGAAIAQLRQCGMRPERMMDTGVCTACDPGRRWFSVRREGDATGRFLSFITLPR
jgi:YfiH family protein